MTKSIEPIQSCQNHYRQLCPEITEAEMAVVSQYLSVKKLAAKEFYLKEGETQKSLGFVAKGLVRTFLIDPSGKEITAWFTSENEYVTDYPNFLSQKPTKYFFQCIEPVEVVELSFEGMQESYAKFKVLEKYGRLNAENALQMLQTRMDSFLFQSPEERYLQFLENSKELFNRISLTDLSTYLGVERQSLSRIRKRITGQ